MFYLKYRSKTISELDNTPVRESIANILKSKHLPHAFLFVGHKGMGKTSTARIFAKAVNCQENAFAGKNDSIEPCNTCKNCASIDNSSSPDVVELDAASNRGIEEIRNLIKEAAFAPMTGRYRVFIIDEAHMITTDAFNALLKTLEEPPESVIFILATTNEEKVPKTIASRCFRIAFGHVKKDDIKRMLGRIAQAENITLPDDVADIIATYSENSFRDATKLLEELTIQNKLTEEEAHHYLGIRSKQNLLEIMKDKPVAEALGWVQEFIANNGNIKRTIEDMLEQLRIQLLIKSGVTTTEATDLGYSITEVTQLMKMLNEAYGNLRISPIASLPLEIAIVEFYNVRKRS